MTHDPNDAMTQFYRSQGIDEQNLVQSPGTIAIEAEDAKKPLTVGIRRDSTNVRSIIYVEGASGRSYSSDYLERSEAGTYDNDEWAIYAAKKVAERIRKSRRQVNLAI